MSVLYSCIFYSFQLFNTNHYYDQYKKGGNSVKYTQYDKDETTNISLRRGNDKN